MPSISGSVVSITGEPVRKAQVMLRSAEGGDKPGYAAASDGAGAACGLAAGAARSARVSVLSSRK